jgi:hypothetical protein
MESYLVSDSFLLLDRRHTARVKALLAMPVGARLTLWTLKVPGWEYLLRNEGWGASDLSETCEPRPATLDKLDVNRQLYCPLNPSEILQCCADACSGSFAIFGTRRDGSHGMATITHDGPRFMVSGPDSLLNALSVTGMAWQWLQSKKRREEDLGIHV